MEMTKRTTRLFVAFLLLLVTTVPALAGLCKPETCPMATPKVHSCCPSKKAAPKPCCCEMQAVPDATAPVEVASIPVAVPFLLPTLDLVVPPSDEIVARESNEIPHYSDGSPPTPGTAPDLGRAPPFA